MGVSVFPVFNPATPAARFESDGKVLAHEFAELDELASDLGIRLFSSFGAQRPIPESFDGDLDDLDEVLDFFDEWYSAAEGIEVVTALASRIATDPASARLFRNPADVVYELGELEKCLRIADQTNARFHLELA